MKKIIPLILMFLLLCGCGREAAGQAESEIPTSIPETLAPTQAPTEPPTEAPTEAPDPIDDVLEQVTTEEKVGQLFLARFDSANAEASVTQYHLSGWILFGGDFEGETPESIRERISALQALSPIPMLMAVDEEGGTVTRVSQYPAFRSEKFPSPRKIYERDGLLGLMDTESEKCQLLTSIGLNVNVGPVCDITTDPNAFMYARSLGQTPEITGHLIAGMVETMSENHVGSVLKHFPGYGNNADTHVGIARDSRSLEALEAADLIPFRYGIDAGADCILVSHTIVEALDPELPASLSPAVHAYLREEMGFDGVVITDDLAMQAITDTYGAGEAAVLAVLAGNDLLCATDYVTQYEAVLQAVLDERIPMERIDEAVTRVLRWKTELGLLP